MSKALDRLEAALERVMKDAVTQRLAGRLQPVEIARKLAQAMGDNQTITARRVIVPNLYVAHLSPGDSQGLEPFRSTLQHELASYLAQTMEESGWSTVAYPRVILMEDPAVPRRKVVVEARIAESEQAISLEEQAGQTMRLQVTPVQSVAGKSWLLTTGPGGRELAHPVTHLPFSLGRALDNDIVLEGPGISRHHAQLRAVKHRLYIVDLSSTNGTFLNGRPVSENLLKDGDAISIGTARIVLRQQE